MYQKVVAKITDLDCSEEIMLREECEIARRLHNLALRRISERLKTDHHYLSLTELYHLLKDTPEFRALSSKVAQGILYYVDQKCRAYFRQRKTVRESGIGEAVFPEPLTYPLPLRFQVAPAKKPRRYIKVPISREFARQRPGAQFIRVPVPKGIDRNDVSWVKIIPRDDDSLDAEYGCFVG